MKIRWSILLLELWSITAYALVTQDNFTGTSNKQNWVVLGNACLTARSGTTAPAGQIPGCPSGQLGGYNGTFPDPAGKGALRLTNNAVWQRGGVIYNSWFPTNSGLNIAWTSYTYNGNARSAAGPGIAGQGADGMSFFLLSNPSGSPSASVPTLLGSVGGALGYACNQGAPYAGIANGYLGIGMDEYGSFANPSVAASGPGQSPNSIVLRGGGNITLNWLQNSGYLPYYSDANTALQTICSTGVVKTNSWGGTAPVLDYPFIPIPGVPASQNGVWTITEGPMAIEPATTKRPQAIPISYWLTLSTNGLLTLKYSYNQGAYRTVINNYNIANPAVSGPLPAYLTFGFAAGTGLGTNVHEITCFSAIPQIASSSSSGGNTQSGTLQTGSQVYLAYYNNNSWWGNLAAYSFVTDPSTGAVSLNSTANWDASCLLTGGICPNTGGNTIAAQTNRSLITWNGTRGIPFQWNSLAANQQAALNPDANGQRRVAFLRGDRSNEINASGVGLFRTRTSILGDIIHSSPVWVGPPAQGYLDTWVDNAYPTATHAENAISATKYSVFKATQATRPHIVYVGSNDGILHGFRSGAYNSSGAYSTSATPNDGREVIGFVPNTVLANLVNLSNANYTHQYYVDATPTVGDVFYNDEWHTWLVGGLGGGGSAIYALDITNPISLNEDNAGRIVIGEWSSANIICMNNANCANDLGQTFGTPVITRFHNGSWGVIFGNGYKSPSGVAAVFVMLVDPNSGATSFYELSTGYGPSQDPTNSNNKNGIFYTTAVDYDGDRITDAIYAGDLFGNLWRFDTTSYVPAQWGVSVPGLSQKPLFSTPAVPATTTRPAAIQPITSKVLVSSIRVMGVSRPRVMVYFGTGQQIPFISTASSTYASGTQALYGVWDWSMATWDDLASQLNINTLYDYPPSTTFPPVPLAVSNLTAQTMQVTASSTQTGITSYGSISSNPVCWQGTSTCATGNNKYGWMLTLPNSGEQAIFNPQFLAGALLVNTIVPGVTNPLQCITDTDQGWSYALNPATGGNFSRSFFTNDQNTFNGFTVGSVAYPINAVQANAVGGFQNVNYNDNVYLTAQTMLGQASSVMRINNNLLFKTPQRLSWMELR